ncbi:hypothetical protein [Escherichia coli]|uniref:hypothetical protein n=1 Tax=Escherichia coli TaxID=562 RepID=UPI00259C8B70|nr:hypothetical protein [Escherichia coli]MDM4883102.1 hypothetical protein [Escherichia coli]
MWIIITVAGESPQGGFLNQTSVLIILGDFQPVGPVADVNGCGGLVKRDALPSGGDAV